MSIAGKRSTLGDEYQLRVALHWLIRLLTDSSITGIQVNSTGIPGNNVDITVDDIVVIRDNDKSIYIQAKKNQTDYKAWSLSDKKLKKELQNSRDQLESSLGLEVKLYSRSPFGEFQSLVETCYIYPDYAAFERDAAIQQKETLKELARIFEREESISFNLAKRITFGPLDNFDDWDRRNLEDLDRIIPRSDLALPILERLLSSHESGLRNTNYILTRDDVLSELNKNGLLPSPKRSEKEILQAFEVASKIGRGWLREIDGEKISRHEVGQVLELIHQGVNTILLIDRPGSGKTCVLLDIAERIEEASCSWGSLFIKGDHFAEARNEEDLVNQGLPQDIVGQCARLAQHRKVVVIIDSLDVLSLNRQYGALRQFLGLIDRLEKINNITVVAACRTFDLEYDPLLRGRKWQTRVNLKPLDFQENIIPFLNKWSVTPESINPELKQLLELPQNLHLYGQLVKAGSTVQPNSAYSLCDQFLEEIVGKNPVLSGQAMNALYAMAEHLMQQRTSSISKVAFSANEEVIRQLISQEILYFDSPGVLKFSHQTLTECLIVRANLHKGENFTQFILKHPQLPFIRPAVRAFFFFLRIHDTTTFRKQVWQALCYKDIAYHIKRLICESLSELNPTHDDWPLLRRIFQNYPDLFKRILWRVRGREWFLILKKNFLEEIQSIPDNNSWLVQIILCSQNWMNELPEEVILLWNEVLAYEWTNQNNLVVAIQRTLSDFEQWQVEGIRELLELLTKVDISENEWKYFGRSISKWVEATNTGHNILWQYITKKIRYYSNNEDKIWRLCDYLDCGPHTFHKHNFLVEQLQKSTQLLDLALKLLKLWAQSVRKPSDYSLHNTSWRYKHDKMGHYTVNGITELFKGVEDALKYHSSLNNDWWKENEPSLRCINDNVLRYFMIQAYKENIEANIPGIEFQLLDQALLERQDLNYEIGLLMQYCYPFISSTTATRNQELILSLHSQYGDDEESSTWINRNICKLFLWIPTIFRTPEIQRHIDHWYPQLEDHHDVPNIYINGGIVSPPLSPQALLELSDLSIIQLLRYYRRESEHNPLDEDMIGGFSSVSLVFRSAVALHPIRFLNISSDLCIEVDHNYLSELVNGVADHLRYRFGNLSPSTEAWNPIEPLPDGIILADKLLKLLERYPLVWSDCRSVAVALLGCSQTIRDNESAERITLLLFWLRSKNRTIEPGLTSNSGDALFDQSITSASGIAAEAAITLANYLAEADQPFPELLPYLLQFSAGDQANYVRIPIINNLPFLMYKYSELGWKLFDLALKGLNPQIWKFVEQCLYFQYENYYPKILPYLNRLYEEGMNHAGDTWGRIATLSFLAGHISFSDLFERLQASNSKALEGSVQVFCGNLGLHQHTKFCLSGLIGVLGISNLLSDDVLQEIDNCFGEAHNKSLISDELVLTLLKILSALNTSFKLHYFFEWLEFKAQLNPLSIIHIVEALVEQLEQDPEAQYIANSDRLVVTLKAILSEADSLDDVQLIQRAIRLQDRFLALDIYGIEQLFTHASLS